MARKPRTTTPPPADETKAQKFKRLGAPRVSRIVAAIGGLHALAGSSYESTEAQRAEMFGAINAAIAKARASFEPRSRDKSGFNFSE